MTTGLDPKTLDKILSAISEFAERELPESRLIALDERDEFPADTIHKMCSSDHSRNGISPGPPGILAAQAGLIDDMGVAAGVLYGRED